MMKRFLVEFVDSEGVTADDLRSSILDGWGYPAAVEEDPSLLKVTELADDPLRAAKEIARREREKNS